MKIEDHLHKIRMDGNGTPGSSPGIGLEFGRILAAQLEKSPPPAPAGAEGVEAGVPVSPAIRLEGLALTESTMETLQAFEAALGELRLSGEALEPYASALEEETLALLDIRNRLPAADPLAGVLDRVATVAYLEAAKVRRGDYLS